MSTAEVSRNESSGEKQSMTWPRRERTVQSGAALGALDAAPPIAGLAVSLPSAPLNPPPRDATRASQTLTVRSNDEVAKMCGDSFAKRAMLMWSWCTCLGARSRG